MATHPSPGLTFIDATPRFLRGQSCRHQCLTNRAQDVTAFVLSVTIPSLDSARAHDPFDLRHDFLSMPLHDPRGCADTTV
jgi:hypothetical protein